MAEIDEHTVRQIINNNIREQINKKLVTDFLINNLTDSQVSILLRLLLIEEEYIPYKKRNIIYYQPSKYDKGTFGNEDKLIDLSIMTYDGYLYAKILDSDNYGDDFNPYHHKFKVSVLGHDEKGNIICIDATIDAKEIKIIDDSKLIKYANTIFKDLNIIR